MKTTNTTTTATPNTTTETTIINVAGAGVPVLVKNLIGAVGAAATSALIAKVLKTGQSQKNYEEVLKEFTAK